MNTKKIKINNNRLISVIFLLLICSPILTSAGCDWDRQRFIDSFSQVNNNPDGTTDSGSEPSFDDDPDNPDNYNCNPAAGSPISIMINASRLSGVAPLSVFFDATSTSGLTDDGFFSNNAAYMDATFSWNFDADNADPTGKFKRASGFVAAHVFEKPGTYRVHLNVFDAAGQAACEDITITVSEFSGTTYYVSADNTYASDSNSGTIDHPFLTPGRALSSSLLGPNVRVLFRNGDTFSISNQVTVTNITGPVIIGSYSDPGHASSAKPIIYTTSVDANWATVYFENCSDIRIMDIAARATAESSASPRYPGGIGWNSYCVNILKYRTEEYENGEMLMNPAGQYATVAECEFHNTTDTGYTSSGGGTLVNDGNALIGNWVHDKSLVDHNNNEHVFRLQGGSRYFIAHNIFGPNIIVDYDALTIRGNTEKVVIYKNRLVGWLQAIWPQNRNYSEEYQHHCIMDSNVIIGQNLSGGDRESAIGLHAKDIVIRNNVIYDYKLGVMIQDDTVVGPSQRIKVYNNTFINPTANDAFRIVAVESACSNIEIKNNLMLDIAGSNPAYTVFLRVDYGTVFNGTSDNNMLYGIGWGAATYLFAGSTLANWLSSGNDENSSFADPMLVSTDYTNADFCKPQSGSPVIDTGEFTPAALDYYGNLRDGSRDIGACENIN